MQGSDHRDFQFADHVEHVRTGTQIEVIGRLVKQQDFWRLRQRPGNGRPLLLPPGQGADTTFAQGGETAAIKRLLDDFITFLPARLAEKRGSPQADVLAHTKLRVNLLVLIDDGDKTGAFAWRNVRERSLPQVDRAALCLQTADQELQQACFPRAIGPDQRQMFAKRQAHADTINHRPRATPESELVEHKLRGESQRVHALLQPENNRHQHPAFHGHPTALRRNKFPLTNSSLCRFVEKGAARGLLQLKLGSTATSRNQHA